LRFKAKGKILVEQKKIKFKQMISRGVIIGDYQLLYDFASKQSFKALTRLELFYIRKVNFNKIVDDIIDQCQIDINIFDGIAIVGKNYLINLLNHSKRIFLINKNKSYLQ